MTKQIKYPVYHPTYEELDAIVAKARAMRARAMRDGLARAFAALKRVVAYRSAQHKSAEV